MPINIICKNCNKEFKVKPSRKKTAKFCSRSCATYKLKKGIKFSEEHKKKIGLANSISNKGKVKELSSAWKGGISFDKKYINWLNHQYRVRRKEANGFHTYTEWETLKAQYNWTCPCCGNKETEIKLTIDHIIPLSKGGSDNIENIQPLCKSCNSKKYNKIIKKYEI